MPSPLLYPQMLLIHLMVSLVVSVDSISVWPAQNIVNSNNNCSGQLDYFLCNCVADNATIEIHLLPGYYHFQRQGSYILQW